MSNEQDNKPERTAMQELIDRIDFVLPFRDMSDTEAMAQSEFMKGYNAGLTACRGKAIELRDTVEKEQLIEAHRSGQGIYVKDEGWKYKASNYYSEKYEQRG